MRGHACHPMWLLHARSQLSLCSTLPCSATLPSPLLHLSHHTAPHFRARTATHTPATPALLAQSYDVQHMHERFLLFPKQTQDAAPAAARQRQHLPLARGGVAAQGAPCAPRAAAWPAAAAIAAMLRPAAAPGAGAGADTPSPTPEDVPPTGADCPAAAAGAPAGGASCAPGPAAGSGAI